MNVVVWVGIPAPAVDVWVFSVSDDHYNKHLMASACSGQNKKI